jgi:hypothetical protein
MPVAGDGLQLLGTLSACSGSIRVIALMRVLLCTILLLVSHGAMSKDAFLIGPWDIGDTRQSVVAATRLGPFEPVVATGGLETRRAVFLGRRTTVSFVFDATDRVEYMQVWLYEGRSYRKARKEALRILDLFEAELGGATIPGIQVNGSSSLDGTSLGVVLDRVLGQAPKLGEKFRKERKVVATTILDLVPRRQPSNGKLTAQLVHSSRHETFFIFLFLDPTSAPDRRVESNVHLERL